MTSATQADFASRIRRARQPYRHRQRHDPSPVLAIDRQGVKVAVMSDDGPTPEHSAKHEIIRDILYEAAPGTNRQEARTVQRVKSDLEIMRDKGQLSDAEYREGLAFRNEFEIAHLDPLRAADLGRLPGGKTSDWGCRVYTARDRVNQCIKRVGGHGSATGLALWWCVGAGESHTRAARRIGGWVASQHVAGFIMGALAVLAAPATPPARR